MRTFGIEEEFQFLEPGTMHPAQVGAAVFQRMSDDPAWHDITHKEFLASQVEHASTVFSNFDDARTALLGFRRKVADLADELGVVAASVGTATRHDAVPHHHRCRALPPGRAGHGRPHRRPPAQRAPRARRRARSRGRRDRAQRGPAVDAAAHGDGGQLTALARVRHRIRQLADGAAATLDDLGVPAVVRGRRRLRPPDRAAARHRRHRRPRTDRLGRAACRSTCRRSSSGWATPSSTPRTRCSSRPCRGRS